MLGQSPDAAWCSHVWEYTWRSKDKLGVAVLPFLLWVPGIQVLRLTLRFYLLGHLVTSEFFFLFMYFEKGSCYITLAGLELAV